MSKKGLVCLINPNFVLPGVAPYALDILTTHLELAGFEVDVVDLTFRRDENLLENYFATHSPLLVGVSLRNAASVYPQEQRVFWPEHRLVIDEIKRLSTAPIILGGVGFSVSPHAALEYLDVPYGVKGPGEIILCAFAEALARGEPVDDIPGLLIHDDGGVRASGGRLGQAGRSLGPTISTLYKRHSGLANRVDNLEYYQRGGLGNLLTKNGCPFACNHCVEPDAKGAISRRTPMSVVDELESLVAQGVLDVHTTDSEFNVHLGHAKAVLREIVRRQRQPGSPLKALRLWIYAHPLPFDSEFADLLAEVGCRGVSMSAEFICREHLAVWTATSGRVGLVYTLDDVRRATRLLADRDIMIVTELLFGLPGETLDTIRATIDASLTLPVSVIGYTLGLQLFPYTPLGIRMAAESAGETRVYGLQSNTATRPIFLKRLDQCASAAEYESQFWFDEEGNSRPVFYFSPDLPEDPETIERPDGKWVNTIRWMQDYVPKSEHYRVALPTIAGDTADDNNYADNPFLMAAAASGCKGAYYSWWRERDRIMAAGTQ
jgi:tryptophan 2-C-methyltransferase